MKNLETFPTSGEKKMKKQRSRKETPEKRPNTSRREGDSEKERGQKSKTTIRDRQQDVCSRKADTVLGKQPKSNSTQGCRAT